MYSASELRLDGRENEKHQADCLPKALKVVNMNKQNP